MKFFLAAMLIAPALVCAQDVGLKLTLESPEGVKDVRVARLISLRVPENQPASPFLEPGPFKATWDGFLTQRIKGEYTFSVIGRGEFKLTINDQPLLSTSGDMQGGAKMLVQLKKGKNAIHAEFTSAEKGESWVRLLWSAKDFIPESVPPTVFTHDREDQSLREPALLRQGRELVANLRCAKCHSTDAKAMTELAADTPSLEDVGARLTQNWLAHWINDPHAVRPDTEMPRVFAGGGHIDQRARDIAAYLVESSAKSPATTDDDSKDLIEQGTRLFANLGCVACHVLPDNANPTDVPTKRISLKCVKHKFQPGALKAFLLKPEAHYQWIRMPDFRLADAEATALSAFLRSRSAPAMEGEIKGDAARGKELFQSSGCLSCHALKIDNRFKSPAPLAKLTDWTRGCASADSARRGTAPDFALTDDQRAAIQSLAKAQFDSLHRDTTSEFAERQMAQLNCLACHSRDRQDDSWSQLKDESDALLASVLPEEEKAEPEVFGDQSRPPLTWIGEKLRPEWAASFIGGQIKYKPRPWLAARMPGFPARAKLIAAGLAEEHGCPTTSPPNAEPNAQLAEIGKKLVGKTGGFSCIQCHPIASQKALSPFEAPAINFAHVTDRLTHEYYDRWVYNPQRVLPGTRMPSFADTNGKTALKETLDGDARKQFDAVWNYLLAGPRISPPQP